MTVVNERIRAAADKRNSAWDAYKAAMDAYEAAPDATLEATAEKAFEAADAADKLHRTEMRAAEISARVEALDGEIVTAPLNATKPADYKAAFQAWAIRGPAGLTPGQSETLRRGFAPENALATTPGSAGGFLVPETFRQKMVEVVRSFGGILPFADVLPTASGEPMRYPTNNDTANVGAILPESTATTELDLTFGNVTLGAYMYDSKMVRVPVQLLQDSAFDLEAWLPGKMGERIARGLAPHLVSGNGTTQPQGLISGATNTVTSGVTLVTSFDDLINLQHQVDPFYRPRGRFVLADLALRNIRKLKDTQGQYLWQPGNALGVESTILGSPYTVDNSMIGTPAVGSRVAAFGDIREAYVVREVTGVVMIQMRERFAEFFQVGFLSGQRFDAKIQNQSAVAVLVGL